VRGVHLQAAYAAYSAITTQAATVVSAMDNVWSGGAGLEGSGHGAADSQSGSASAQQQQARLAVALASNEDGDDVYVQVRICACVVRRQAAAWQVCCLHDNAACMALPPHAGAGSSCNHTVSYACACSQAVLASDACVGDVGLSAMPATLCRAAGAVRQCP
jgi:hypothetical protein